MDPIIEFAILFIAATILAYISKLIKQPIIPAYIIAGVALVMTGVIVPNSLVDMISTLGIAFLLFIVGLEIDFDRLKDVGIVSTLGCTLVCFILFCVGYITAGALGIDKLSAIYVGLVAAFSSTMIVVKLLSDKNQLDTLYGRIILGVLLMQDILAIIALFTLSTLNNGFSPAALAYTFSIMISIFALTFAASRYIFPIIFRHAAKTEELLFTTSVSICLLYIGLFHYMGFSIAIGAFLAGVALANLPYNIEIISLVKPIRDFFAVIFFVSLGMMLKIEVISSSIRLIIALTALTLIIKPIFTMIVISLFGYKTKPTFYSAISLAQASEFGMVLLIMGLSLNHITEELFSAIVLVTIVTMTLTAYFFEYKSQLYRLVHKYLKILERIPETGDIGYDPKKIKKDVLMVGDDRLGYNIFNTLLKQKHNFVVVDYNPEVIKDLARKKIPCIYGDIGDIEILNRLDLASLKMVISTAPDKQDSLMLIKKTKEANKKTIVIVTSMKVDDAIDLYEAGADYVILPHFLGGERVSLLLEEVQGDTKKMIQYKLTHLKELKRRRRRKPSKQKKKNIKKKK